MSISIGLRVLACVGCLLAWLPRVAAQAEGSPAASPAETGVPLSAQGETMAPPPSEKPPSEAPPSAAPAPAEPVAAPPPAAAVPVAAAAAAHGPQRQGHDGEHPPARPAEPEAGRFTLRLSLGLQAALIGIGSELSLRRPAFASLDVGYAPWEHWALLLRVSSWLSFGSYVTQFVGAGASYLFFASSNMFLTGALGIALHEGSDPYYKESVQGLAAQLDLGQDWPISSSFDLGVGAHFEIATHWLGTSSLTDFGVGLFISAAYR